MRCPLIRVRSRKFVLAAMLIAIATSSLNAEDGAKAAAAAKAKGTQLGFGEPATYKRVDGRELKVLLVKPSDWKATDRRPAVVFFHGGGWQGGSPKQFEEHSKYLASRGMICVNVEYRLLTAKTKVPPIVCIQDAKSAMRWTRANAETLGIDPMRIAASGGSAGGHLAGFVGLMEGMDDPQDDAKISPRANALVLFNPVIDNSQNGYGADRIGDRLKEFSPAHNVSPQAPPTIIFVGSKDTAIRPAVVERFRDEMVKAGVRCEARIYQDQPHGFFNYRADNPRFYLETLREADLFLTSLGWLQGEPTLPKPTSETK